MGQPLSTPRTHTVATSFVGLPLARGRGGLAQAGHCQGCGQVAVWCACAAGDGGGNGRAAPSTAAPDPAPHSCSPVSSRTMVEMREFVDGSRWQMSDRSAFVRSPTLGGGARAQSSRDRSGGAQHARSKTRVPLFIKPFTRTS